VVGLSFAFNMDMCCNCVMIVRVVVVVYCNDVMSELTSELKSSEIYCS
jgi:hypothetical protein